MEFGKIDGIKYSERKGIYGITLDPIVNKIMIIKTPGGLFLPGGGIENNETHEECLHREFLEETGFGIFVGDFICESSLYGISPKDNSYQKSDGSFYVATIDEFCHAPKELDHEIIWMNPANVLNNLKLENQRWAVKQFISNFIDTKNVDNVWDKVAFRFGETGPRYWNEFGARLIEFTNLKESSNVLDIGMGRGASLFPASETVGNAGLVVGIDLSSEMVNETKKDIKRRNRSNIEVHQMNSSELSFKDNSFANVINGFGFGYLVYTDDQFKEIKRVLKPGGTFSICQWGEQKDQEWLTEIINSYLPPAPKSPSSDDVKTFKFQTTEDLSHLLEIASFKNITAVEDTADVIYKDKDQWWNEMWTNAVRGIFERIEKLNDGALTKLKEDIFSALDQFKDDRGYVFRMTVIYAKCSV